MTDEIRVKVASYGPGRALAMVYFDPTTGKKVARSSGTTDRTAAERAAAVWQDELNSGRYCAPSRVTWEDFAKRYVTEKAASLAEGTQEAIHAAFAHVERILAPDRLVKVSSAALGRLTATLREEGLREATIARHLRHLKAALRWGERVGLMAKAPRVEMPKRAKGAKMMMGRPITGEEFERMIAAVPQVCLQDSTEWGRLLWALWLGSLRIGEALALGWDEESPIAVDWSGEEVTLRFLAEAQKSGKDEILPAVPDFAAFLLETPEAERIGRVFRLANQAGRPVTRNEASKIVASVGRKAGVVTNKAEGHYATAHDLRRSFGTRWAKRVTSSVLRRLMRHAAIATTEAYYVDLDAADLAADLRARFPAVGNTSGNIQAEEAGVRGE